MPFIEIVVVDVDLEMDALVVEVTDEDVVTFGKESSAVILLTECKKNIRIHGILLIFLGRIFLRLIKYNLMLYYT